MFTYVGIQAGRSVSVGESETLTYVFKSDSQTDATKDLLKHRDCPRIWSKHPEYRSLYLKKGGRSISQGSGSEWSKWTVEATYTVLTPKEKEQEQNGTLPKEGKETDFSESTNESEGSGVDWFPKFSMTFEDYPTPMMIAFDFNRETAENETAMDEKGAVTKKIPIVASNLEPYDPPPEVFQQNATVRIARNVDVGPNNPLGLDLLEECISKKNTVNESGFEIPVIDGGKRIYLIPALCSRLKIAIGDVTPYEWSAVAGTTRHYAQLECQWVIDHETWSTTVLDVGTYYLDPEDPVGLKSRIDSGQFSLPPDTKQRPFTDAEGNKVQGLLNGKGGKIGSGVGVGDASFNEYFGYELSDHKKLFDKMLDKRPLGMP
jgi:hypothetical protein